MHILLMIMLITLQRLIVFLKLLKLFIRSKKIASRTLRLVSAQPSGLTRHHGPPVPPTSPDFGRRLLVLEPHRACTPISARTQGKCDEPCPTLTLTQHARTHTTTGTAPAPAPGPWILTAQPHTPDPPPSCARHCTFRRIRQ